MLGEVQLRVLGPVQLWVRGEQLDLGPARQRAVLAALVADEGRPVAIDTLIDRVWDEKPPAGARSGVYSYVTRLRRIFGRALPDTGAGAGSLALVRQPAGYVLDAPPEQVDFYEFRSLVDAVRHGSGDDRQNLSLLDRAVELWRGPAFADLTGAWVTVTRDMLVQQRLDVVMWWARAQLRHGHAAAVVGPLRELLAQHPLVEPLAARLIEALHRDGRTAEALACYAAIRNRLIEDLGAEPGSELRRLHQAMLEQDGPRPEPRAPGDRRSQWPRPAQLPPDVAGFTGRRAELDELDRLLLRAGDPETTVISAIGGTAGVGKTALAVHWAHRVADRFPDGQLYIDLRGFGPDDAVRSPGDAVRTFLGALAVPPERIPSDLDAQVGLYRSLLHGRRMLVVLDNARDTDHVRPLLPGSSGCLVVVTSRSRLTGLVTAQGAYPLALDLLEHDAARQMLARRLGPGRVAAEPAAVEDLIVHCDRLPLALAIAAARAATRPRIPLAALVEELRGSRGRLDAFVGDDSATDIRAVMSWSLQALDPAAARLFRLLALHPGPDIPVAAAAGLGGLALPRAHRLLNDLAGAHLVTEHASGRYGFHDLLRAYAREQVQATESAAERRLAVQRVLDHYLHSAHSAAVLLDPHRDPITIEPWAAGVTPVEPSDQRDALAWFGSEHANLMAAIDQAVKDGFDTHAWQLAWTVNTFLDRQGHWHDWLHTHRVALSATQRLADRRQEAYAHRGLGHAYVALNRHDEADVHFQHALELYARLGDQSGQAHIHANRARLLTLRGRHLEAIDEMASAMDLFQSIGDQAGYAQALGNMGWLHTMAGDYDTALACGWNALKHFDRLDNRFGQAATLDNLGCALHHLGRYEQAVDCYQRALERLRGTGARFEQAQVNIHLGDAFDGSGRPGPAHAAWRQALEILEELDSADADRLRARLAATNAR